MKRVWVVTRKRFRNDDESYDVLAAFKTEREAIAAMMQYGHNIRENEYNEISHNYMYGSTIYHIKENDSSLTLRNDFSLILAQEDILNVIPVEIKKFNFKQHKILENTNNTK